MGYLVKGEKHNSDIEGGLYPTKICRIPGCGEPVRAKKLCAKHHQRMRRTGNTQLAKITDEPDADWNQDAQDIKLLSMGTPVMENHRAYGIVRKIDEVGRITIPKEYSIFLGALPGLPMEFFWDSQKQAITFHVYNPGCYFCGSVVDMSIFKERKICRSCIVGLMEETC